jgi:MazG family protein
MSDVGARAREALAALLDVVTRLRDPAGGCPWDREQTLASLVPHTLEEAYEVADAVARDVDAELIDELGDLLFQIVFYAQIAAEAGRFDFADIADAITAKLVRRHPHVFADAVIADAQAQTVAWETYKASERAERLTEDGSALAGVGLALPALTRAAKLQRRAARVGFDWPSAEPVWDKVLEELEELRDAERVAGAAEIHEEFGDVLFALVNLARHHGVDAESALRGANAKFERRFRAVESRAATPGHGTRASSLDELDALWDAVKREEGC